ncbi:MAG: TRAP transporter small permease subunit [Pseudomonadota bacterium]
MRKLALKLDRLSQALHTIALWGAVLAVVFMLGAACWQVVARYALAQPPAWTEEIARFSMVWAGLLGASCAFRLGSDPSLFPEMRNRTGLVGRVLSLLRFLGVLGFVAPILWYSFFGPNMNPARGYVARLAGRQAETIDLPMTVFGIAIPLAFSIIFLHLIARLAIDLTADPDGETK